MSVNVLFVFLFVGKFVYNERRTVPSLATTCYICSIAKERDEQTDRQSEIECKKERREIVKLD